MERCPDPQDRRVWRLRLTAKAEPHLLHIKRYRAELRVLMTRDLEPEVLETVALSLRKMKDNLHSAPSKASA